MAEGIEGDTANHTQPPARGATTLGRHLAALLAYVSLALSITWPLALRLGSAVPHDVGDPVGFTWVLWWNAHALPLTQRWLDAPIFHPSTGAIVYQDSLLGVWPFTTGVQWVGASPLAAHNLLVIGSFAVSAFTAYLLCVRLFRDTRAAFAGGLVFGFALYRMAQVQHVNILLTFWIPLTLVALHEYMASRRWQWMALGAACWALQAVTAGYFLAYSTILIALWALFFLRWRLRDMAMFGVTFGLALAAIWPWLSLYRTVHEQYGFQRGFREAEFWGADVTSLLKAPPLLAIWGPLLGDAAKEDHFFPGLTLACACVATVMGSRYWRSPRVSRATIAFLGVAAVFGTVAAAAALHPTSFEVFGTRVWLARPFKPLSWLCVCLILAVVTSPPVGRLVRERSVPGFYALAACAMWLLALGPTGRFMGARIWYKAPYAWLMMVPGSDAIRVPARFWMLVVLCLAVVVAFGVSKLRSRPPTVAWTLSALLYAGLVAEAWIAALPLPAPPAPVAALESSSRHVPVLEVPLGSYERDLGAMYRQMSHERPIVNGYSAYEPRSFTSLRVGLDTGDAAALRPYSERTALDILVHTGVDKSGAYDEVVRKAGAVLVTGGTRFRLYHLAQQSPLVEPPPSAPARLARITDKQRGDVTAPLTSDAPLSWVNVSSLDVELAARCKADEVALDAQPGLIHAAVQGSSSEGRSDLWSGSVGERSVRGALAHPAWPRLRLRFAPTPVERLRIDLRVPRGKPPVALDVVRVFGEGCR